MRDGERKRTSGTPHTFPKVDGFGSQASLGLDARSGGDGCGCGVDNDADLDARADQPARSRPARLTRPRWKSSVDRAVQDFTARLKVLFASQIADDPREFKRYAVLQLKRNLPPGPGRPADPAVTLAIRLRAQGAEWRVIYPQCIPGFTELAPDQQQLAKSELRSRYRSRRNTARRRRSTSDAGANRA